MSLIRYRTQPISSLQNEINRMFDEFGQSSGQAEGLGGGTFAPPLDVREDADNYFIEIEVPGIARDNLNISLQENVLTVRGQKEDRRESEENGNRRVERSFGSFARSVTLPRNVSGSDVQANLDAGVLTITLPKEEEAKPRQINIGGTVDSGDGKSENGDDKSENQSDKS